MVGEATERQPRQFKRSRTKWHDLTRVKEAAERYPFEHNLDRGLPIMLRYFVFPLLRVVGVMLAIVIVFGFLTSPNGESTSSPYADFNDAGFFLEPYHRCAVQALTAPPRPRAAAEQTIKGKAGRDMPTITQDSLPITTVYFLMTPSVPSFDAEASAVLSPNNLKRSPKVCVRVGFKSSFQNHVRNTSLTEPFHNCDALIDCCHYLPIDRSPEDWLATRDSSPDDLSIAKEIEPPKSILLGVYVGDDAAFRRLLFNRSGERPKFLAGIIKTAQMGTYSGVRLWVPLHGFAKRGLEDRLGGLARDVATKLREINRTFGFFLPQGLLYKQRGVATTELTEALDSPFSLLVYPEFSVFGNTTDSTTGSWPTPKELLAHASF